MTSSLKPSYSHTHLALNNDIQQQQLQQSVDGSASQQKTQQFLDNNDDVGDEMHLSPDRVLATARMVDMAAKVISSAKKPTQQHRRTDSKISPVVSHQDARPSTLSGLDIDDIILDGANSISPSPTRSSLTKQRAPPQKSNSARTLHFDSSGISSVDGHPSTPDAVSLSVNSTPQRKYAGEKVPPPPPPIILPDDHRPATASSQSSSSEATPAETPNMKKGGGRKTVPKMIRTPSRKRVVTSSASDLDTSTSPPPPPLSSDDTTLRSSSDQLPPRLPTTATPATTTMVANTPRFELTTDHTGRLEWCGGSVSPRYVVGSGQDVGKWRIKNFQEFQGGRQRHNSQPMIQKSHELRRRMEQGIIKFNQNPKDGLDALIAEDLIDAEPGGIAEFLLSADGLNKVKIGEYLGSADEFNRSVLFCYANQLDFTGRKYDDALRYFLSRFRLPGEAQQIDRLMQTFSERYCRDNDDVFQNTDVAYLLAYSMIILNTDAHSPRVKTKMKKKEFIQMCIGLTNQGVTKKMLGQYYESIVKNEIKVRYEYLEQLYSRIQATVVSRVKYRASRRSTLHHFNSGGLMAGSSDDTPSVDGDVDDVDDLDGDGGFDFRSVAHLDKLTSGNIFTKHGRKGEPHRRRVWLSDDTTRVCWQDPVKNDKIRYILTKDIVDVMVGRDTSTVFKRRVYTIPDVKDALCFSVTTEQRTLDLEGDGPDEVRIWVDYLTHVCEENTLRLERERLAQVRLEREQQIIMQGTRWKTFMFPNWHLLSAPRVNGDKRMEKFRRIWLQGMPPSVRRVAWPRAIGNKLQVTRELYDVFRQQANAAMSDGGAMTAVVSGTSSAATSVQLMKADLPNTFPELAFFHNNGPLMLGNQLESMLRTYIVFRPDVGYMRGMSHLAAMLLLYVDEYPAFVCFVNLLHSHYFLSYLRMDMSQIRWRFEYFEQCICGLLPKLYVHFKHLSISLDTYFLDWCLSLYSKVLTTDLASRVWDAYLLDGEIIVIQVGVALLTYFEERLLRASYDDCLFLLTQEATELTEVEFWPLFEDVQVDAHAFEQVKQRHATS